MATGAEQKITPPPSINPDGDQKEATDDAVRKTVESSNPFTFDQLNPANLLLAPFGITPEDVPKIMMRAALIILGAAFCITGIAMVMSGSKTAAIIKSTTKDIALDVIPAGKVAKVAKKVL